MIKKVPVPIAGLSLGFAALGNLLPGDWEIFRCVCGAVSALLAALFLCKCVFHFDMVKEDMKNPVMASISGTFSMTVILLSVYARPLIGGKAVGIWYFGIGLHVLLILYFTGRFLYKLNMKNVFASYYIVYVGIVTASVTAPAFGHTALGFGIFWFGLACCLMLLILVTFRYVKYREIPEPARPLFCIYTAPVSLCLAGYLQSAETKSLTLVLLLMTLAGVLYITVLVFLPGFLVMPFYPSYAAFTFPVVISAIGMKMSTAFLVKMGVSVGILPVIVIAETVIAVCLVIYVFIHYMKFLFTKQELNR